MINTFKESLLTAIVFLIIGIGIGCFQDGVLRSASPNFFMVIPSIAGKAIPYTEGLFTAFAGVMLYCFSRAGLAVPLLAVSTTLGLIAGSLAVQFLEPRLGIWWSVVIPPAVIFVSSLLGHAIGIDPAFPLESKFPHL